MFPLELHKRHRLRLPWGWLSPRPGCRSWEARPVPVAEQRGRCRRGRGSAGPPSPQRGLAGARAALLLLLHRLLPAPCPALPMPCPLCSPRSSSHPNPAAGSHTCITHTARAAPAVGFFCGVRGLPFPSVLVGGWSCQRECVIPGGATLHI